VHIPVTYTDTTKHFDVQYRREHMGFVLSRYNHDTKRRDAILLSGACLWDINKLQRIISYYQKV
jgi:hypothetical protein